MVAGAKLRRAQDAITAGRPYAEKLQATLARVAQAQSDAEHPLLQPRENPSTAEVVVVTSNRGLCGAFNSNVLKLAEREVAARREAGMTVSVATVGRKANEYFRRRDVPISADFPVDGWVQYGDAVKVATAQAARFASGEVDEVVLVYSEFVTVMTQRPCAPRLLPGGAPGRGGGRRGDPLRDRAQRVEAAGRAGAQGGGGGRVPGAAREPGRRARGPHVGHGGGHAQHRGAGGQLTLQFNRARQAAITKELVEIVSGAEAL